MADEEEDIRVRRRRARWTAAALFVVAALIFTAFLLTRMIGGS